MSDRERVVFGEDDFDEAPVAAASSAVDEPPPAAGPAAGVPAPPPPPPPPPAAGVATHIPAAPPPPPAAGALPPVIRRAPTRVGADGVSQRPLGAPSSSAWLRNPGSELLVAAALGILLGWAATEAFGIADMRATSKTGYDATTGLWTGVIAMIFGGTLLAYGRAAAGAWEVAARRFASAVVPLFVVGFVAGFAANALYGEIVESVLRSSFNFDDARLYFARSAGWAIFGAGVGIAIGLADRSRDRAINGGIGGGIGGAVGGIAFQYASSHLTSSVSLTRLVGLAAVGGLVALATRAVETARREAWLQVVAGGMSGKEFIVYHDLTRIGASPEAEVFLLKDPGVLPDHARISLESGRRLLTAAPGAQVLVNGTPIARHVLRSGDHVQLGDTVIAYSERLLPSPSSHQSSTEGTWI